jgi:hypothetical protein
MSSSEHNSAHFWISGVPQDDRVVNGAGLGILSAAPDAVLKRRNADKAMNEKYEELLNVSELESPSRPAFCMQH